MFSKILSGILSGLGNYLLFIGGLTVTLFAGLRPYKGMAHNPSGLEINFQPFMTCFRVGDECYGIKVVSTHMDSPLLQFILIGFGVTLMVICVEIWWDSLWGSDETPDK